MVDISHLCKSIRNYLFRKKLTFTTTKKNEIFSMLDVCIEMQTNNELKDLLSDNAVSNKDLMKEDYLIEIINMDVIDILKKSEKKNLKNLAQFLLMINLLFYSFRNFEMDIEKKIENLKIVKKFFNNWNQKNFDKKYTLHEITFNNIYNTIENFLILLETTKLKFILTSLWNLFNY
jgi:hypothetical protein